MKLPYIDEIFTGADFSFPHNFLTKNAFNLLFFGKITKIQLAFSIKQVILKNLQ